MRFITERCAAAVGARNRFLSCMVNSRRDGRSKLGRLNFQPCVRVKPTCQASAAYLPVVQGTCPFLEKPVHSLPLPTIVMQQGLRRSTRLAAKRPLLNTGTAVSLKEKQNSVARSKRRKTTTTVKATGKTSNNKTSAKAKNVGPSFEIEQKLWSKGREVIVGVDEAGRGPLAGPVVAAACILKKDMDINGIDDSKKLTEKQREAVFEELVKNPDVTYATCVINEKVIDEINILEAAMSAMEQAVESVTEKAGKCDFVLVDGNRIPAKLDKAKCESVVKGDAKSLTIAAASIIAKVTRDRLMMEYDKKWPGYGFAKHNGYPTVKHKKAIKEHGPCEIHRMSFQPLSTWFPPKEDAPQK